LLSDFHCDLVLLFDGEPERLGDRLGVVLRDWEQVRVGVA